MGHSQASKAETHARIVQIAADRFRKDGLDGVGVADLMKDAGLTVGGFYKHFGSRDDLVAEAVQTALDQSQARSRGVLAEAPPERAFPALVENYLNAEHRDAPENGCAFGALAGDAGRGSERVQALFNAQAERTYEGLARLLAPSPDGKVDPDARAKAIAAHSLMVGALTLARATGQGALSDEILAAARSYLISAFGSEAEGK
jgi:TetR/AcrR family transcriptional regulator, transcriptional repressor for nem operon